MHKFHKHKSNKTSAFIADKTDGNVPDGADKLKHGVQIRRTRSAVLESGKGNLRGPLEREKLPLGTFQHLNDTESGVHKQQLVHRSPDNAVHASAAENHEGAFEIDDSRIGTE